MKKRIVSALLVMAMLFSCLPASVFAATDTAAYTNPTVAVVDNIGAAGSTVNVDVKIVNNPGVAGAKITVAYHEDLTLVAASSGAAFKALDYTRPGVFTSPCNFTWDSENTEATGDGVILTLTFKISEDAEANEKLNIDLSYRYGDFYDSNLDSVAFDMISGCVQVLDYVPGDVNSDGIVNGKDVTLARRINAGGYNITARIEAANVNGDTVINGKDITLIRRYHAGGYGVVLLPSPVMCEHEMEAVEAKAPTCDQDGNSAYWYCSLCENYFADVDGATQLQLQDTVLPATGHNLVTVPGKDPTKTETGLTDGIACNNPGCTYVEKEQEIIPVLTGYKINYDPVNGEDYIGKQTIVIPADKYQYFTDEGLELPQLQVPGYRFIGWSKSQASADNIITEIPAGSKGEVTLYAHWDEIVYTVTFDTPDIDVYGTKITGETILNATEYTVNKGKTLQNPACFGYTFMGWSNDDGFIVNRIKPGTTGHITLHANWTSDRNKATSYSSYGDPIIIEDDENGQFLFVYNIGKIDNVPLNEVEFIGKTESLNYSKEIAVVDTVNENYIQNINSMISNATTMSSGWTLAEEWEDIYSTQESAGTLSEKSDERTSEDGTVVGGKYFVSNSEGGSSHVSTESGSSVSNSSKITTEDSIGINSSYDKNSEKYCETTLGVENVTELSASVTAPAGVAKVSAGVTNTTTIGSETTSGRKDQTSFHTDSSLSSYVGTVNTSDSSAFYNSSVSNSSTWNSNTGYEQSSETAHTDSVTNAIKEQISKTTQHNVSKALGATNTTTGHKDESSMSQEEYSTSFTYFKGTQTSTTKKLEFNSSEPGYYRIITAGTVHVYGVVGYDVATHSYYTYCFNVMDDTTREILDYSKDNALFNDCENGIVTFEIPYEVNEYIAGVVGKTDGLEIDYAGTVTGFEASENYNKTHTIVVPQYDAKANDGAEPTAVKVTALAPNAFESVKDTVKVIVLPTYITEIPDYAFTGCTNLETVIAFGVTSIGDYAFAGCTNLGKVVVNDQVSYLPFSVDTEVVHIGENAFQGVPSVAIAASCPAVADAAIQCGAQNITVSLAYMQDAYNGRDITVAEGTKTFKLIGNGGIYEDVEITSYAEETVINYMNFANNDTTPLTLHSDTVGLYRVSVQDSPNFALVMTKETVALKLMGEVVLSSKLPYTVLSKNVTMSKADQGTTSSLSVNGEYLVCGEITNSSFLNGTVTTITADEYDNFMNACTVTFDANGGSVDTANKIIFKGTPYGELPAPERTYYAFEGWYTEAEGGEQITAESVVAEKQDVILYAHWRALTVNIHFDANQGSVDQESKLVYVGEAVGQLPTATRDGYNFNGWFTADDVQITSDSKLQQAGELTVVAKWTVKSYKVSWNTGTGYSITVRRTSSPLAGAGAGVLSNGSAIYHGDVLEITYAANTGYNLGSKGQTEIHVTGDVTGAHIYASANVNSYTATWSTDTGYSITVKRTSSPLKGAACTTLSSGAAIYYGDVLSITYTASTGYSLGSKGSTSITVTGNVTKDHIYASASLNSYTYKVVYKSSNNTNLGGTEVTYKYGTTNTISAPAKSGYITPGSQSVKWDSTSAKTITFTYEPTPVSTTQGVASGNWWHYSSSTQINYSTSIEYRNRKANSVEVRIHWTNTLSNGKYGYAQYFDGNIGGVSVGTVGITTNSTWNGSQSGNRSVTVSSGWVTVPLNTTNQTTVSLSGAWWDQLRSGGWSGSFTVPAY